MSVASLDELKKQCRMNIMVLETVALLPRKKSLKRLVIPNKPTNESCSYKNSWSMTKNFSFHLKTSLSCLFGRTNESKIPIIAGTSHGRG